MQKRHRIIIDTNLWINFLLSKQFVFLDILLNKKKVVLLFSDELLNELLDVVHRPKLHKYFSTQDIENTLEIINRHAEYIKVTSHVNNCRDEKDNFLLALAKDGSADFLLTGDKDLLILKRFDSAEIITIAEYKVLQQL